MTDWTELPWRTMCDPAGVLAARTLIEDVETVLARLNHESWEQEAPIAGTASYWTASDEDERTGIRYYTELVVGTPQGGLCTVSLHVDNKDIFRQATVSCAPRLVEHLHDTPIALIRFVTGLFTSAVGTKDVEPVRRPAHVRHADLKPDMTSMIVEYAERYGMDPTAPIRIETWDATPLSPDTIRTTGSGRQTVNANGPNHAGTARLSCHADGSVRLGPLISTIDCDGFDAMELLHVHRDLVRKADA